MNPRQWITNPQSARVVLGDQTNNERAPSSAASGSLGGSIGLTVSNNKKYVTNLSPLPRSAGGEDPFCSDLHQDHGGSPLENDQGGAPPLPPAIPDKSSTITAGSKKQLCSFTMSKYNFLKTYTVKPKTPGSVEKRAYLHEPARRNVRAVMLGHVIPPPVGVMDPPGAADLLTVPPQRSQLALSPLPLAPLPAAVARHEGSPDEGESTAEQRPEAPATVLDSITTTPPPIERNLFHYFNDTSMTVVDILCFDSPMTVPPRQQQSNRGGSSPDVQPVHYYLSPGPQAGNFSGPPPRNRSQRSRSAPSASPFASPFPSDLSWHSDGNNAALGDDGGSGSRRSHSAPGGRETSLPSPWERDHTSEGSPFLLDDDADDIVLEEVLDSDDDTDGRRKICCEADTETINEADAGTPPQQAPTLEAYSPATIALIVTDEDAQHELLLYLDRAAGLVCDLFLQRCVVLFSNYCLSQAMVISIELEESHDRFVNCVARDAFLRQAIDKFVKSADRITSAAAAVARTPPASQKAGNGGRRRQYLVPAAGGPPQVALPSE